ncbi:MAG: hypothetical protein AB8H86_09625 [Polyangiales bacterium]
MSETEENEAAEDDVAEDETDAALASAKPHKPKAKWPYGLAILIAGVALYFAIVHRNGSASEVEGYLLGRAGEDIGAERLEDVEARRVWRVDLVQLDGLDALSEALVDFDRDDRYDERWEFFTDGRIRRHHSSEDDGRYDVVEMREGDEWVPAEAPAGVGLPEDVEQAIGSAIAATGENAPSEEEAETAIAEGVRSQAEIWLLTQQGRSLDVPLERDARGGVPWYVDLYQEEGSSMITGARLDLDRDGRADQRWTYEGEERVQREVSTRDDEVYDEVWEWTDAGWSEVAGD